MPKPQNITSQRDFGCRRTRFQSSDVDLDISCRKRFPINNRLASQPPLEPEVNTDFDAEIAEAVRVEKEMAALNRHLAEKQTKMSEYFRDMEIQKPTTTAAANCNIPGCTTPSFIPPDAVPVKTREPVRVWDGNSAKSKLGFRSKFKKEEPERKTSLSVGTIPERIMKQIKKFFT
ncbi:hypothetical protein DPMN_130112 [Dreissena polymorpha]|uniref:Uncharacterized protein n=2 Tax=Dreissena polymorpha TaxID=45954 RepID=A0A9D4H437_DREPO|nr:hypothetical protein DPMN_130112 [Dreissena polymorpha]